EERVATKELKRGLRNCREPMQSGMRFARLVPRETGKTAIGSSCDGASDAGAPGRTAFRRAFFRAAIGIYRDTDPARSPPRPRHFERRRCRTGGVSDLAHR